jgi:hypothetical protein
VMAKEIRCSHRIPLQEAAKGSDVCAVVAIEPATSTSGSVGAVTPIPTRRTDQSGPFHALRGCMRHKTGRARPRIERLLIEVAEDAIC